MDAFVRSSEKAKKYIWLDGVDCDGEPRFAQFSQLLSMKQQEHESPAAFSQRVLVKAKSIPPAYSSIVADPVLTAVIYRLSHYLHQKYIDQYCHLPLSWP